MLLKPEKECCKRVLQENGTEIKRSWIWFVFGGITLLWHNIATNIAYHVHTPQYPLWDLGFQIFPENESIEIYTEIIFIFCAISTVFFIVLPSFMHNSKQITSTLIVVRMCKVSGFSIILRTISFLSTSLPSPSHHCRPGSTDYAAPSDAEEIAGRMDPVSGCGDLIFSGHTSNTLIMTLTVSYYAYYLLPRWWKWITFGICVPFVIIMGTFIIIAQNHYTVDVVVALYTVPLLYFFLVKVLPDSISDAGSERYRMDSVEMDSIISNDAIALAVGSGLSE